jgi:hypothetical protein
MSVFTGNSSVIPKEAWAGIEVSSIYFYILFLFLTKAKIENFPKSCS